MTLKYTHQQHAEYLRMIARISENWIHSLGDDTELYSAVFWDLLTYVWLRGGAIRKTDALRSMRSIKSPHTAGKYLEAATRKGLLVETSNPEDARSKLLVLDVKTRQRLDAFFDTAVTELRRSMDTIRNEGPFPKTP